MVQQAGAKKSSVLTYIAILNGGSIISTIILASKSPRRRALLEGLRVEFKTLDTDIDEDIDSQRPLQEAVCDIARRKAEFAARRARPGDIVIAADTLVLLDGAVLGKPEDEADAFKMLNLLSGTWHQVYTGLCVMSGSGEAVCDFEMTDVKFRDLELEEIEGYIETGEPFDKAGSYGIQERGALLVEKISGDYFNVMGLPLSKLGLMLRRFGVDLLAKGG